MVLSPIHLIGGGPGTLDSLRVHLSRLLAVSAGKKPLVAYVGAASGDNQTFQKMIGAEIAAAGGRMAPAKLASKRAKVSAATTVLSDCDVVFVSGGDVVAGMQVLHDRGVVPLFNDLARAGRPMIGISAGSIMLARAWLSFNEDTPRAEPTLVPCLGLAPVYVDAHAAEDRWIEVRKLLQLLAAQGQPDAVGYGLTRKGGLSVKASRKGVSLAPFGTALPKFVVRDGRAVRDGDLALVGPVTAPPRRGPEQR